MKAYKRTWTDFMTGEIKSVEISHLILEEKSVSNCKVEAGIFLTKEQVQEMWDAALREGHIAPITINHVELTPDDFLKAKGW